MEQNSFDIGKIAEKAINEALKKRGIVNILIAGKTGVGKSTLINAVFQGNFAITGQGRPVTQNTRKITKPNIPLAIFDTRGLELKEFKKTLSELENFVKNENLDIDPQKHIHATWLCIDENSRRVEKAEIELCERLSKYMPIIGVITKSSSDNGFRHKVQQLLPTTKNIVRVNSISQKLDNGYIIEPSGLTDLVDITMEIIPEGHKMAFIASQKVSMSQKKNKAHGIVVASASASAAAGASPIPFSDAFILIPIQVGMLASITAVFGFNLQKSFLVTLISATITGAGATFLGKTLVTNLIKLIPGVGTITGGAISATTAAILTTTFGEIYIATLSALTSKKAISDITNDEIITEFKKRFKKNKEKK